MPCRIVVVDCGMGNLHSVRRKFSRLRCEAIVTSNPQALASADKLVLPGVGHFRQAMRNLKGLGLLDALNDAVLSSRKPILGICLGMQLMAKHSEEGDAAGLGWIDADVVRFKTERPLQFKIPHVGWNQVAIRKGSPLMKGIPNSSEFYFVHSYYARANVDSDVLNESEYEHRFVSAVERDNVFGVQYHPEKSHDVGDRLLQNFVEL